MKVGDIVKFKNGRSYYQQCGYSYVWDVGVGWRPRNIPISDKSGGDKGNVEKPFPKNMRGKLAIITKMDWDPDREAATEVCMITHDPYGNGDKIIPLPNRPNCGYGFIEGDDLEVISSGADQ